MPSVDASFSTAMPEAYRFPFPAFPNGWFPVALSHEVPAATVMPCHRLGRDIVVYRTASGVAKVVDAYCPHLGAHLGFGGTVEGEDLQCPFHHWRFGPDGRCTGTFTGTRPPSQSLGHYPVSERNGAIFIWHHADGRDPNWELPIVPETESSAYRFWPGRSYSFASHPQEIFENQPDSVHLATLHGWQDIEVEWRCDPGGLETELRIQLPADDSVDDQSARQAIISRSYGPSCNFTWVTGSVAGLAVISACPTGAGQLYNPIYFYVHVDVPEKHAAEWVASYLAEYEKDIPIWERKRYVEKPPLTRDDGPINKMRSWYQQWYC